MSVTVSWHHGRGSLPSFVSFRSIHHTLSPLCASTTSFCSNISDAISRYAEITLLCTTLCQIRWVLKPILEMHKCILHDTPHTNKFRKDVKTSSLIIHPARAGTSERLLASNSTSALVVVVDVACRVTEAGGRVQKSVMVR